MKQTTELPDGEISLGCEHYLRYTIWAPDLAINPHYAHLAHLIRMMPVVGAIVRHKCQTETGWHEGCIHFKTELTDAVKGFSEHPRWRVESWDPLTIAPSLLARCPCKDHGHIKNGRWVPA